MPQNDGEVRVEITGDSSKIKKELKETEAAVKNTTDSISEMTDALENTSSAGSSFNDIAESADSAAKSTDNLGDSIYNLTDSGLEIVEVFNEAEKSTTKAADGVEALKRKLGDEAKTAKETGHTHENGLNPKIKETGEEAEKSSGKVLNFSNALNSMAKKIAVAKITVDAAKTTVNAITSIAKSAVENFAEYEQLVGGVETLFEDSADVVQEYAANAYKTAGMSANDYMETVTSFSASLLQSLGNDTEKAAAVADKAITDMADNANKMGTPMESIQNAYQGFAKANYTMLDNLKLGYGGTKEEMQRLLDTANEYNRQQGINTNYQIESYADIVEAIHVVQTEMGISGITAEEAAEMVASGAMTQEEAFEAMGTTAKEAATTIQGSLFSVKAAWQNLLTGIADENADFDTLIANFVDSAATALDNLLPRVKTALEGVGDLVTELSPVIAEAIPELVDDVLPSIVQAAVDLVTALVNSLVDNGGTVADTALDIIDMLVKALEDNAYGITDGAITLITTLVNGISDRLPELVPAAVKIVMQVAKGINDNTAALIDAALQLIISLGAGLVTALPQLLEASREIPESIADSIINYDWGSVAKNIMANIADALDNAQKEFQVWLDNTFSGGTVYGGDIANVDTTDFVNNMREGIEIFESEVLKTQENFEEVQEQLANAEYNGAKIAGEAIAAEYAKKYQKAAKAIADGEADVLKQQKATTSALKEGWESLEHEYATSSTMTEAELYNKKKALWNAYGDASLKDHWKYIEDISKYDKDFAEEQIKLAQKEADEKQKIQDEENKKAEAERKASIDRQEKIVSDGLSDILKTYRNAYDELDKKREAYRQKLMSVGGDLFFIDITKDENGNEIKTYTVNNLDEQLRAMREYHSAVKGLREQGASDALISELTSLNDEDSAQFAKYLSEMSSAEFAQINELYNEKQKLADELANDLYASEAKKLSDSMLTALDELSAPSADYGKEAADSYIDAFKAEFEERSDEFAKLFEGTDFSAEIKATVESEMSRYSAAAYTAPAVQSSSDTNAAAENNKKYIDELVRNINKPVQLVLDGKVISEIIIGYQAALKKQTGG